MMPAVIVAGLGRCGTSLVMQMLHAGGVPCIGTWPDFEYMKSLTTRDDPAWLSSLRGTAVKLIDPHRTATPCLPQNRVVIWLDRDPRQQALSQIKLFNAATNGTSNRALIRKYQANLSEERPYALRAIGNLNRITLAFERLIETPLAAAETIAAALRPHWIIDPVAMAACVKPRAADCLPGFLEIDLSETPDPLAQFSAHA